MVILAHYYPTIDRQRLFIEQNSLKPANPCLNTANTPTQHVRPGAAAGQRAADAAADAARAAGRAAARAAVRRLGVEA